MKYWRETIGVTRRILIELLRRRRSLIFWSIFPVSVLILNGYILAERAKLSMEQAFETAAPSTLVGAALFFQLFRWQRRDSSFRKTTANFKTFIYLSFEWNFLLFRNFSGSQLYWYCSNAACIRSSGVLGCVKGSHENFFLLKKFSWVPVV